MNYPAASRGVVHFDLVYEEDGLLLLTPHPPETARRAAAVRLDRFMTDIQSKRGVRIAMAERIVNSCKKNAMQSDRWTGR